jgi:hypothetical protein
MRTEAAEMRDRITSSGSYDEALGIISEYVNITDSQSVSPEYSPTMGGM